MVLLPFPRSVIRCDALGWHEQLRFVHGIYFLFLLTLPLLQSQSFVIRGPTLLFPVSRDMLDDCFVPNIVTMTKAFEFNYSVVNRGNIPVYVTGMSIEGEGCDNHELTLDRCDKPFVLVPGTPRILSFFFRPSFKWSSYTQKLHVNIQGFHEPQLCKPI